MHDFGAVLQDAEDMIQDEEGFGVGHGGSSTGRGRSGRGWNWDGRAPRVLDVCTTAAAPKSGGLDVI
jgi:hypothetical protein